MTGKPILHSLPSSFVYLNLKLLEHYRTVFPGKTFFGFLTCKKPKERHPNYLWPQWLVPCSRPAGLTLFAHTLPAGGIKASSSSYACAHKDAWRCSHTIFHSSQTPHTDDNHQMKEKTVLIPPICNKKYVSNSSFLIHCI